MNIQYIISKGFARYVTKYMTKSEPLHIFNIIDNNKFRVHVVTHPQPILLQKFRTVFEFSLDLL